MATAYFKRKLNSAVWAEPTSIYHLDFKRNRYAKNGLTVPFTSLPNGTGFTRASVAYFYDDNNSKVIRANVNEMSRNYANGIHLNESIGNYITDTIHNSANVTTSTLPNGWGKSSDMQTVAVRGVNKLTANSNPVPVLKLTFSRSTKVSTNTSPQLYMGGFTNVAVGQTVFFGANVAISKHDDKLIEPYTLRLTSHDVSNNIISEFNVNVENSSTMKFYGNRFNIDDANVAKVRLAFRNGLLPEETQFRNEVDISMPFLTLKANTYSTANVLNQTYMFSNNTPLNRSYDVLTLQTPELTTSSAGTILINTILPQVTSSTRVLFTLGQDGGSRAYIAIDSVNRLVLIYNGTTQWTSSAFGSRERIGLVYVFNKLTNTTKVIVNGQLLFTGSNTIPSFNDRHTIGSTYNLINDNWNSTIDNYIVYDRMVSDSVAIKLSKRYSVETYSL